VGLIAVAQSDSCNHVQVQAKLGYRLSNWDNAIFDSSLLLDMMTGTPDSPYRKTNIEYINAYVVGDASASVSCAPLPCMRALVFFDSLDREIVLMLLDLMTGTPDGLYRKASVEFVQAGIIGDASAGVSCAPPPLPALVTSLLCVPVVT
jgi:hypothetical protein